MNPISTQSAAISGMSLQASRVGVSANNVANLQTEGFRASRVRAEERAGGGVRGRVEDADATARMAFKDGSVKTLSNTDIAEESVERSDAANSFKANAAVVKSSDRMLGTLIDIFA
ncbi:MAG: flagellar basal body rod protein [Candidatus Schekmanbacteria bacterium]|nr:flagellar basal body rod protein [Candidatus Schekmanbacteria bacterium]